LIFAFVPQNLGAQLTPSIT